MVASSREKIEKKSDDKDANAIPACHWRFYQNICLILPKFYHFYDNFCVSFGLIIEMFTKREIHVNIYKRHQVYTPEISKNSGNIRFVELSKIFKLSCHHCHSMAFYKHHFIQIHGNSKLGKKSLKKNAFNSNRQRKKKRKSKAGF